MNYLEIFNEIDLSYGKNELYKNREYVFSSVIFILENNVLLEIWRGKIDYIIDEDSLILLSKKINKDIYIFKLEDVEKRNKKKFIDLYFCPLWTSFNRKFLVKDKNNITDIYESNSNLLFDRLEFVKESKIVPKNYSQNIFINTFNKIFRRYNI